MKRWKFNQFVFSFLINLFYRSNSERMNFQTSEWNHFILIMNRFDWALNVEHKWIICLIDGIRSFDNVSFFIRFDYLIIIIILLRSVFLYSGNSASFFDETRSIWKLCVNSIEWTENDNGVEQVFFVFIFFIFITFWFSSRKKIFDWWLDEVVNDKDCLTTE